MANTNDALNPPSPPNRVFYSTGRMLGVEDFQADQDYYRGRLAQVLVQLFGTGTVLGLNVTLGNDLGDASLELQVSPGIAFDRVGRVIEVPRQVCIRLKNWYSQADPSILNMALHGSSVVVDVFVTFVPCTRGATPCFASQDDYDATDAFSPNRWLDSFAMQLVPRTDITDPTQKLPQDPWSVGATDTTAAVAAGNNVSIAVQSSNGFPVGQPATIDAGPSQEQFIVTAVPDATHIVGDTLSKGHASGSTVQPGPKLGILAGSIGPAALAPFGSGAAGIEYPPDFDNSSVFLARVLIQAKASGAGQAPTVQFDQIKPPGPPLLTIDNSSRLFVFPSALIARSVGLTSGKEGA
jgi:hypothetical protein